jgi:hypothetical protein
MKIYHYLYIGSGQTTIRLKMVLRKLKNFMEDVRNDIDCERDVTDSDCCEVFIEDARREIEDLEEQAGGAYTSPEWDEEYTWTQDQIRNWYNAIAKCKRVSDITKVMGVGSVSQINGEMWAEYQAKKKRETLRGWEERDLIH